MTQEMFNWAWLVLFIVICAVRKAHERKAGQWTSLKGIPIAEAVLMLFWGLAAGVPPFFYMFGTWLDFANFPFKMPAVLSLLGVVLFLISIWLLHRSHADLGKLWSPAVEPEGKQRLVTDGVYERIRHPMYTAHVLWGVAQTLLLPNFVAGLLALVLISALITIRIPREERALLKEFGDEYRRYMGKTGRILPKLNR
jgi:protein-S-isoprenylcysteine O-methyltransferase Ste14